MALADNPVWARASEARASEARASEARALEDGGLHRDCIIGLLEQAARTIDSMWMTAQSDGHNPAAVALGEASHGVHRALIALQSDEADLVLDPEARMG